MTYLGQPSADRSLHSSFQGMGLCAGNQPNPPQVGHMTFPGPNTCGCPAQSQSLAPNSLSGSSPTISGYSRDAPEMALRTCWRSEYTHSESSSPTMITSPVGRRNQHDHKSQPANSADSRSARSRTHSSFGGRSTISLRSADSALCDQTTRKPSAAEPHSSPSAQVLVRYGS